MIKAFPDGIISYQFILINPNTIKNFIINDEIISFDTALLKEENLKKYVTKVLESSLNKTEIDDINLIKLVSIYDKEKSELMDLFSFKDKQLIHIKNYIKNDGNINDIPNKNFNKTDNLTDNLTSLVKLSVYDKEYPKILLKGEQHKMLIKKEMEKFLTYYEDAASTDLKEYICGGFINKIFPEMKKFRSSTNIKNWEFVQSGAKLQGFKTIVEHTNKNFRLSQKSLEDIAMAANLFATNEERSLMIKRISGFSLIEGEEKKF